MDSYNLGGKRSQLICDAWVDVLCVWALPSMPGATCNVSKMPVPPCCSACELRPSVSEPKAVSTLASPHAMAALG
jgi:hypothetical protein